MNATPFTAEESTRIRADFPLLASYTFLNAASMAPLPLPTKRAVESFLDGATLRGYLDMPRWMATVDEARRKGAAIVGCDVDELAFIRNTAEGVSTVASGFRWAPGDEVVINDLEFPSNVYPWLNLQRRGVRVVTVKSVDGRVPVEAIEQALTAKTRMVAISTVQFTTGYRADLTAIGALCRANGVRFFVDAIQSLGAIPMDVKACGVDYLACGGHKWLCSLEGIGLFYCAKERLDDLDLITAGWHTVADALNFGKIDFTLKGNAQRFEEGTPNLAGIYGLNASLATVTAYGVDRNFAHILSLTDRLIDGLRDAGYDIVSPVERREERSGIVIFAPKNRADTPAVATRLERTDVLVIPRGEGIRVSPHFYNTVEDVERMLGAVSSAS